MLRYAVYPKHTALKKMLCLFVLKMLNAVFSVERARVLEIDVKNSSNNSLKRDLSIVTTFTPSFLSFSNIFQEE